MVICCVSALRARAITLGVTVSVSALPRACAHTNYFARYLTVMVYIRTLVSTVAVALAGSLVW